jgi:hypothetical protein
MNVEGKEAREVHLRPREKRGRSDQERRLDSVEGKEAQDYGK